MLFRSLAQVSALALLSLLFPLFWVWMLVDAVVRDEREYPARNSNEKLVWVLVMVFVQFAAVLYFFMVYRVIQRGSRAHQYAAHSDQAPTAAA